MAKRATVVEFARPGVNLAKTVADRPAANNHEVHDERALPTPYRLAAFRIGAGLVGRSAGDSFASYVSSGPEQLAALEACERFARTVQLDSGGGLMLLGTVGTGKSHLARAINRHLLDRRGWEGICFTSASEIIRDLRGSWGTKYASGDEEESAKFYAQRSLLVLDDLGSGLGTESERVQLLEIVDRRYKDQRPTVVTSNLNLPQLREAVGERILDRLLDGAVIVPCKWPSHRRPAG